VLKRSRSILRSPRVCNRALRMLTLLDLVDAIAHVIQTIKNVGKPDAQADEGSTHPDRITLLLEVGRVLSTCGGH